MIDESGQSSGFGIVTQPEDRITAIKKALEEAAMRVDKLIADIQALEKFNRSYALRMAALAAKDIRALQSDAP